jgi:adenylate kinase family enzyme
MERIAIIGISGSGKTTFAHALQRATGLPLHHADQLFWRGAWQPVPVDQYLEAHSDWVGRNRWIIEGYVDPSLAQRLQRADLIIYLAPPPWVCAGRVVKRWLAHRKTARLELPPEALERLNLRFLWVVLSGAERPNIEAALRQAPKAIVQRLATTQDQVDFFHRLVADVKPSLT